MKTRSHNANPALLVHTFRTLLLCLAAQYAHSCEFCTQFEHSLTLDIENSDVAIVGRLNRDGMFQIGNTLKGAALIDVVDILKIPIATPDILSLIVGSKSEDAEGIQWTFEFPLTVQSLRYLTIALDAPKEGVDCLRVFWPYLDSADRLIADDAYRHFAKADYAVIRDFKSDMDRNRVIKFVTGQTSTPELRTLGFVLLGICGTPEDASYAYQLISSDMAPSYRGMDSVIACYLSLAGEAGLDVITNRFLKPADVRHALRVSAIDAIVFHLNRVNQIPRQSLFNSLQYVLDHPDVADFVIDELIKFKDWSAVEKIKSLFIANDIRWLRVACAKYLLACPNDDAKTAMIDLRAVDADAVRQAETGELIFPTPNNSVSPSLITNQLLASWLTAPWFLALLAGILILLLILFLIRRLPRGG